jgi:hypothetical protein
MMQAPQGGAAPHAKKQHLSKRERTDTQRRRDPGDGVVDVTKIAGR